MAWFYIFANLFRVWPDRRQLDSPVRTCIRSAVMCGFGGGRRRTPQPTQQGQDQGGTSRAPTKQNKEAPLWGSCQRRVGSASKGLLSFCAQGAWLAPHPARGTRMGVLRWSCQVSRDSLFLTRTLLAVGRLHYGIRTRPMCFLCPVEVKIYQSLLHFEWTFYPYPWTL